MKQGEHFGDVELMGGDKALVNYVMENDGVIGVLDKQAFFDKIVSIPKVEKFIRERKENYFKEIKARFA
jgi:hypothetical protein